MSFLLLDSFIIPAIYGQGFIFTKKQVPYGTGIKPAHITFKLADSVSISASISTSINVNKYHLDCIVIPDKLQKKAIFYRNISDSVHTTDSKYTNKGITINLVIHDSVNALNT